MEYVKYSKDKECDGGEIIFVENVVFDVCEEIGCVVLGVFGVVGVELGFFVVVVMEDVVDERDKWGIGGLLVNNVNV